MSTVLFLALIIATIIGLAVALAGQNKAREEWQKSWDSNPNPNNPDNANFEGKWSGSYSYNSFNSAQSNQAHDCKFIMKIERKGYMVTGNTTDSLGEAKLKGVCDYPHIRITKSYIRSNRAGYVVGSNLGMLYYEGLIHADNKTISGTWFKDPVNKSQMGGNFEMILVGRLNETDDNDKGVKEKETVSRVSKTTYLESKVKSKANTASNTTAPANIAVTRPVDQKEKEVVAISANSNKNKPILNTKTTTASTKEPIELSASTSNIKDEYAQYSSPTPASTVTGTIVCKHCQAETSESFDFCLYCSKALK